MSERERAVGRVLVVDDDADMCDYLATALPLHGFEVESRTEGERALGDGVEPGDGLVVAREVVQRGVAEEGAELDGHGRGLD